MKLHIIHKNQGFHSLVTSGVLSPGGVTWPAHSQYLHYCLEPLSVSCKHLCP